MMMHSKESWRSRAKAVRLAPLARRCTFRKSAVADTVRITGLRLLLKVPI